MQRSNLSETRPDGPSSHHPEAEGHNEQSPVELNSLHDGSRSIEVQRQLCNLQHAYNLICLPQKPFAAIKAMLRSNEMDENVAPPFSFQPQPQVLHAGYDFHRIGTPHNCLVAGCDHIFAVIICQPNDESPWNFFVTEFYRVQGTSKLRYQISPTFQQVDHRSGYLDLLRYDIRIAVENYNTMVLGWWARLAARMGGRVFELRHVDAAVAQLKEQLLDPEMVAGWMNERLSPLGRGIFVRLR
ncbi:hypothetical protein FGLOB1_11973 [Fusarium globosum]|uniref:Uncharacterized protein n=1 Tax=Fusarium globosum TaxID=78864 RepID=A0A8H6D010_9HYPO|nr:hypothetical protein FGLOB1_11973 [Fusarium globosum]